MTKKILLVNDIPGYGKVAVSAMTPILVRAGFEVFNLPTAIISNTLNYGKFALIDTTEYMKEAVAVWKELGIKFDAIAVGFIANENQAEFLAQYCRECSKEGTKIYVDPIMGDNGKLYNSVSESRAEIMKRIIASADYVLPNMTEACVLTGEAYKEEGFDEKELYRIANTLGNIGRCFVIITSAILNKKDNNLHKAVVGCNFDKEEFFISEYEEIPLKVNGTGDIFAAYFIADTMRGENTRQAMVNASESVRRLIEENKDIVGEYNGLPVEAGF